MRGKSIDNGFVIDFVKECTALGKTSPEEICEEALSRIAKIDEQLKLRIKLNDILSFFSYKKNYNKAISINEDDFSKIDKDIANEIGNVLHRIGPSSADKVLSEINSVSKNDCIFCIKKMLECKILHRTSTGLICQGANYTIFYGKKS